MKKKLIAILINNIVLVFIVGLPINSYVPKNPEPLPKDSFVIVTPSKIPAIYENFYRPPSPKPRINIDGLDPEPRIEIRYETTTGFTYDPEVSWYGPGFYGNRTACGLAYTTTILGVAHRSLPCGTKVTFQWEGKTITVPVIDRGPYVAGRQWDLSGGLCVYLDHCFTGPIYYRVEK